MYLFLFNLITDLPEGAPGSPPEEAAVQRWVVLARDGDALAARRLYRTYAGRVYRSVRPLVASDADAEDVVQDAFMAALGGLGRYQPRPGTRFIAWLITIALNTARKQVRRTRRWRPLPPAQVADLQEADAAGPGPAARHADALGEALDRKRLGAALLEALAELSERDRRIVVLRYGAELDASEVGRLVGEAPATVRKVCQRQRERLLDRLSRHESGRVPAPGREPAPGPVENVP